MHLIMSSKTQKPFDKISLINFVLTRYWNPRFCQVSDDLQNKFWYKISNISIWFYKLFFWLFSKKKFKSKFISIVREFSHLARQDSYYCRPCSQLLFVTALVFIQHKIDHSNMWLLFINGKKEATELESRCKRSRPMIYMYHKLISAKSLIIFQAMSNPTALTPFLLGDNFQSQLLKRGWSEEKWVSGGYYKSSCFRSLRGEIYYVPCQTRLC